MEEITRANQQCSLDPESLVAHPQSRLGFQAQMLQSWCSLPSKVSLCTYCINYLKYIKSPIDLCSLSMPDPLQSSTLRC